MADKAKPEGYIVVIEWDGKKPPTSYYNRFRYLTSRVRGDDPDKTVGPIARRAKNNQRGLILQEGVVFCGELSLARTIGLLAQQYGASFVQISQTEVIVDNIIEANPEDVEALNRIAEVLGHRGHPYDERDWTITCLAEARMYAEYSRGIINCPSCMATSIRVRSGKPAKFRLPTDVTSFEAWARLRFFNGSYEIPIVELDKGQNPPKTINVTNHIDKSIYNLMASSDLTNLDHLSFIDAFAVLDAIFLSRLLFDHKFRQSKRVRAIAYTLMNYPDAGGIRMAERADQVDLFDASSRYNPQYISLWWSQIVQAVTAQKQ